MLDTLLKKRDLPALRPRGEMLDNIRICSRHLEHTGFHSQRGHRAKLLRGQSDPQQGDCDMQNSGQGILISVL